MDNVLVEFFSVAVVVYCLGIAVLVMVTRRIVEYFWATAKTTKLWNDLLLPLIPVGMGVGLSLTPYPFPELFTAFWARIFLGLVCGFVSAHVYKIAKKWFEKKEQEQGQAADSDQE